MGRHAILSPSGSGKWMVCTPSALQESKMPYSSSSDADKGTLAHALGEILTRQKLYDLGYLKSFQPKIKELQDIQSHELYDDEMLRYCYDYRDFIIEAYHVALAEDPEAKIFLEKELDLGTYIPGSFGTSDVIIISNKRLHVIDLKYGVGIAVSSVDNKQMKIYALGALDMYAMLFEPDVAFMTIFQPRKKNTSTWDIQVIDLLDWAENTLKPTAFIASTGAGEFVPGEHCKDYFCKIRATCKARAEHNMELAKYEFREPPKADDNSDFATFLASAEIADIILKAKRFREWLKDVEEYALEQAINHKAKFEGLKLITTSGERAYIDKQAVELKLLASQFKPATIFKPKELWGITEMEKILGKQFDEYLGPLIKKKGGKKALVPLSAPGEEVNSLAKAQEEFADDDDEDLV